MLNPSVDAVGLSLRISCLASKQPTTTRRAFASSGISSIDRFPRAALALSVKTQRVGMTFKPSVRDVISFHCSGVSTCTASYLVQASHSFAIAVSKSFLWDVERSDRRISFVLLLIKKEGLIERDAVSRVLVVFELIVFMSDIHCNK